MKKSFSFLVLVSVLFLSISCSPNYNSIKRMQRLEEGVSNPTTKEELEEAIKKYEKRAMDLSLTEGQVGMWYKILGTRYLDQQMYGKAFECFQKAITYYPDNANLYFYIAVCAGYLANSSLDYEAAGQKSESLEKKMNYLHLCENAYLTALKIDPNYYRAMYGIGVLYVFELDESEKAIPYLERFLQTQTKDTNGMFVLARAYYTNYEFDKAIQLYDRIIALNPNAQKTAEAQANKKIVLDAQSQQ